MANSPNTYFDPATIIVRESETDNALGPNFSSNGGMTYGSCQPGIGIATDQPNLTGDASQWTLLDQDGAARTPQNSQYIGDVMTPALIVVNGTTGDGNPTGTPENATLATLAAGWVGVAV
jgi:hypothetical protein